MANDLGNCASFDSNYYACDLRRNAVDNPGYLRDHGSVLIGHFLYLAVGGYGGPDDLALFCCDLNKEEWSRISLENQGPRFGNVFHAFVHNDTIVVWTRLRSSLRMFSYDCVTLTGWTEITEISGLPKRFSNYTIGTYHEGRQEAFLLYEDTLNRMNVGRDRFQPVRAKGRLPKNARWSMVSGKDALFFVGNSRQGMQVCLLKLRTLAYSELVPSDQRTPSPRSGFSLALVNGRLLVVGGEECRDAFEMFTVKNRTWKAIEHSDPSKRPSNPSVTLEIGFELHGDGLRHVYTEQAIAVSPNKMIITGGRASDYTNFRFVAITPH